MWTGGEFLPERQEKTTREICGGRRQQIARVIPETQRIVGESRGGIDGGEEKTEGQLPTCTCVCLKVNRATCDRHVLAFSVGKDGEVEVCSEC